MKCWMLLAQTNRCSTRPRPGPNRFATSPSWSWRLPGSFSSWWKESCSMRSCASAAARRPGTEPPQVYGSKPIEIAWTAAPALIVFVLVLVTTRTLWEVDPDPPRAAAGRSCPVRHGHRPPVVVGISLRPLRRPRHSALSRPTSCTFRWVRHRRSPARLPDAEIGGRVPQLLGAPAGGQDRPDSGPHQPHVVPDGPAGFVPRPVRRVLRHATRQHAPPRDRSTLPKTSSAGWPTRKRTRPPRPAIRRRSRAGRKVFLGQSCVNCHRVAGTPARARMPRT